MDIFKSSVMSSDKSWINSSHTVSDNEDDVRHNNGNVIKTKQEVVAELKRMQEV